MLWGGWAVITLLVFSKAQGIFHAYYTVALAPAIAALAGAGGVALWRLGRRFPWASWMLPATILATAGLAVALLARTPSYVPWLHPLVVLGAALGAAGLWLTFHFRHRALLAASAAVTTAALLAGPAAYSLTTVRHATSGPLAAAGPTAVGARGPGGFGGNQQADQALISYLESHKGSATYLVAAFGSQSSAPIIIATGQPVITVGGFNGSDPAPTLAQFQQLVAHGKVRYVLVGDGGFGGPGGPAPGGPGGPGGAGGGNSAIQRWVTANGHQVDYGGSATLYDVGSG